TQLQLSAPTELSRGQSFNASAEVTAGGPPLAGVPVKFTFRGETTTVTTDAQGRALVALTAPDSVGAQEITAAFVGTRRLDPSSAASSMTVS
ncbi:MAG TPA: Ig-like domain repeat protein, partial [Actinomycetota bacterium]|nr:Ig-like domain repeat protein [Actinomycetota bacterium]